MQPIRYDNEKEYNQPCRQLVNSVSYHLQLGPQKLEGPVLIGTEAKQRIGK